MAVKKDYYEVLGIDRDADQAEIKKAYRKLAKKYHPDTNSGSAQAEQRFKEATEAYTVLGDPEKKKLYDRFGHTAFDGSGNPGAGAAGSDFYGNSGAGTSGFGFYGNGAGTSGSGFYGDPFGGKNGGSYREYHFSGDMDDIFRDIFGDGHFSGEGSSSGNGFRGWDAGEGGSSRSGFRGRNANGNRYSGGFAWESGSGRGADLSAEVSISFEDAAFGCDKLIRLSSLDGGGGVQSLQVHIPAGIDNGKRIRLRGKGMPGSGGGDPGDLLLKVTVTEKPGFERKGMDVYTTVNIPFATAVFGGETQVQTIDGPVICRIREGTQSGTRIRLKGKGIVSMKDPAVRGDQYATVQIQVPGNLSPEAKQKLKEFERACGQDARGGHGRGSAA